MFQGKFYFLIEDNIRNWVVKTHLAGDDGNNKRFAKYKILDVGSGCALSTMVYGDLFPNSEAAATSPPGKRAHFIHDQP